MKATNGDVLATLSILGAVPGDVGKKLKVKAARMMRELTPHQEKYQLKELDLQDAHAKKDASGNPVERMVPTKNGEQSVLVWVNPIEYNRAFRKLLAEEVEVDVDPLVLEDLKTKQENYVLTHEQMAAMGPFLSLEDVRETN